MNPAMLSPSLARSDSRWGTYLKAGAFVLPGILLWTLTTIFIVPKLQQICADTGGQPLPSFLQVLLEVTQNGLWIFGAAVSLFVTAEWLLESWTRYRRLVTGLAVFSLNSLILAGFFAVALTFAMVAPALINAAR